MTGFGRGCIDWNCNKISIEIRSINSKTLDVFCRWNGNYRGLENSFRPLLSTGLSRGKIDISVSIRNESKAGVDAPDLQTQKLSSAFEQLKKWAAREKIDPLILLPNLLQRQEMWNNELDEEPSVQELEDAEKQITMLLKSVIAKVNDFRSQEGEGLKKDLLDRVSIIESKLKKVEQYEAQRITTLREKLVKALDDLGAKWRDSGESSNRFEQEMIYYLEKWDITEEKVRLSKHCKYFVECVDDDAAGKKLAFIVQEMGREINTLGSKANEVNMQRLVVEMKDELEKIKEQLFNIL